MGCKTVRNAIFDAPDSHMGQIWRPRFLRRGSAAARGLTTGRSLVKRSPTECFGFTECDGGAAVTFCTYNEEV